MDFFTFWREAIRRTNGTWPGTISTWATFLGAGLWLIGKAGGFSDIMEWTIVCITLLALLVAFVVMTPRNAHQLYLEAHHQYVNCQKLFDSEKKKSDEEKRKESTQNPIKATRLEVHRWIASAKLIIERIEAFRSPTEALALPSILPQELFDEADFWLVSASRFVSENANWFLVKFNNDDGFPPRMPLENQAIAAKRDEIANKKDRLEELLEEIGKSAPQS